MAKYVGLDWASKGWFGVILRDDGGWETDLFPSIWSVWKYHSDAARDPTKLPHQPLRFRLPAIEEAAETHRVSEFKLAEGSTQRRR